MMRVLSVCLRLLAGLFHLFPLRRRVAFLSRQAKTPSSDFCLLAASLRRDDPALGIRISTTDSELSGKAQFALHMLEQLWLASTSRVVILDGYNPAVCIPRKRRGTYVMQLWHASGAIKKFGFQCLDTPAGRSAEQAEVACMPKNYDCIVAAGPGAVEAYANAFGYPTSVVVATGLPHIAQLMDRVEKGDVSANLHAANPWLDNGNLNVVYAPTLRRSADANWLTQSVDELARALADAPVNLIVSKHPLTDIDDRPLVRHEHVHVLARHSTTSLLSIADVLVSDYSAISLEAGLVHIPTLFFVPDIEQYRQSPGLNIDPVENTLLYGTSKPHEIASALTDQDLLDRITERYQSFIDEYFAGVAHQDSANTITALIRSHIEE